MNDLRKVTTRLPAHIITKLKIHCAIREMPLGVVMALAIEKYVKDYEKLVADIRK
jgi:hypothetical protein